MRRTLILLGLLVVSLAGALTGTPPAVAAESSDLSVYLAEDSTGGPAVVGTTHQQFASIRNYGPSGSPAFQVTVTASAGQELVATTAGSSYTCTRNFARTVLTCQHPAVVANAIVALHWSVRYTTASNKRVTIKVSGPNPDPVAGNNTAVITTFQPYSDLRVTAADDTGGQAVVGTSHFQYARVHNDGSDDSPSATVTVTASAGQRIVPASSQPWCSVNAGKTVMTCAVGLVEVGHLYQVAWHIEYLTASAKTVTVKLSGPNYDPVPGDNTAVIETAAPAIDLSVDAVDATGGPAIVGSTHDQVALVSTGSTLTAEVVTVTITASAGQVLHAASGSDEACEANRARTILTCRHTPASYSFILRWSATYTTGGAKTVTVKVDGPTADPDLSSNKSVISTPAAVSDLDVVAADLTGGGARYGAVHHQRALITNAGPDTTRVTATITASAGQKLTPTDTSVDLCTSNAAKTVLTCSGEGVNPAPGLALTWKVEYQDATPETVTIAVKGPHRDPHLSDNKTVIHTAAAAADLEVWAHTLTGGSGLGVTRTQQAVIDNHGPDATDVEVVITASPGQRLAVAPGFEDTCIIPSSAATTMHCGFLEMTDSEVITWLVTSTTATAKTVTVTADGWYGDPVPANNKFVIETPRPASDLVVHDLEGPISGVFVVGTTQAHSATIGNGGPDVASPTTLTVTASAGQYLTLAPGQADYCRLNRGQTIMKCTWASIAPVTESRTVHWFVTYTTASDKTLTAAVSSPNLDLYTPNNKVVLKTAYYPPN